MNKMVLLFVVFCCSLASAETITATIRPTVDTNDEVLREVEKLRQRGVFQNVEIMESFPVQIRVTGPRSVIEKLHALARDILLNASITPLARTNDKVLKKVKKLQAKGILKDVVIMESFPVQIRATGPRKIIQKLQDLALDVITGTIHPTTDTNDIVLAEVRKLQRNGILRKVRIMESFPVQIQVTGPRDVIAKLQSLAQK